MTQPVQQPEMLHSATAALCQCGNNPVTCQAVYHATVLYDYHDQLRPPYCLTHSAEMLSQSVSRALEPLQFLQPNHNTMPQEHNNEQLLKDALSNAIAANDHAWKTIRNLEEELLEKTLLLDHRQEVIYNLEEAIDILETKNNVALDKLNALYNSIFYGIPGYATEMVEEILELLSKDPFDEEEKADDNGELSKELSALQNAFWNTYDAKTGGVIRSNAPQTESFFVHVPKEKPSETAPPQKNKSANKNLLGKNLLETLTQPAMMTAYLSLLQKHPEEIRGYVEQTLEFFLSLITQDAKAEASVRMKHNPYH